MENLKGSPLNLLLYTLTPLLFFLVILWGFAGESPAQDKPTPDGKIVFSSFQSGDWEIWLINPDGTHPVQLTHTFEEEQYPALSAGGSKIAYATNAGEIWWGEMGEALKKIPSLPANCTHPDWSPDGTRIVLVAYTFIRGKEESDLWIANLKKGTVQNLMNQKGIQRNPSWSPDGSAIIYTSAYLLETGKPIEDLYMINSDGTNPRILAANRASNLQASWSPNGEKIAFASDRTGNMEIWVMERNGKKPRQLTDHRAYDGDPSWSPDGSKVCFASTRSGKMDIWIMDCDGRNPRQVTGLSGSEADSKEPHWSR